MKFVLTIGDQRPEFRARGALYLDIRPHRRELRRDGKTVYLTDKQFKLMQVLMGGGNVEMSNGDIFFHVWREELDSETGGPLCDKACVCQLISNLRPKLRDIGVSIASVRKGYGYKIIGEGEEGWQK